MGNTSNSISPRKYRVRKNGPLPSYMNPTKSSVMKQTGISMEIDGAVSYIQKEMQRIHSSDMTNYDQLVALERLEKTNQKLALRNNSIL